MRAGWECEVQRPGDSAAEGRGKADDDLYWTRVPLDERARLTWELSCELYLLAARNGGVFDEDTGTFISVDEADLERRLPRAAFRITRR